MTMMTAQTLSRTHFNPMGLRRAIVDAWVLRAQRRSLLRLDNERLADLGLSRKEALAEAKRPVWDVPCHWRR